MREFFNDYVQRVFPARRAAAGADWPWPGDEWAGGELKEATWRWIAGRLPKPLERVVEYGPGSGKYTELLLSRTQASVTSYEISEAFNETLLQRCASYAADDGRLDARLIDWTDNGGLVRDFADVEASADMVLALDVLMMMDFQSALVFIASAATMLRRGGRLLATFADGGSQSGFERMLKDLSRHSAFDLAPCTRFHWVGRELLDAVLPRVGFRAPEFVEGPAAGLDVARLYVCAEVDDTEKAKAVCARFAPSGDSTNRVRVR